jgi:multidrug efflux pump subunit AcrB
MLPRKGFPSVDLPIGLLQVTSFDKPSSDVDLKYAEPLVSSASENKSVKSVAATSTPQGTAVVVTFNDGVDVVSELGKIEQDAESNLPDGTSVNSKKIDAGALTTAGDDILISIHGDGLSASQLDEQGQKFKELLESKNLSLVERITYNNLIDSQENLVTGETTKQQTSFDRFYSQEAGKIQNSSIVAIKGYAGVDQLELFDQVKSTVDSIPTDDLPISAEISANFAEGIRDQIGSLQKNLLEGLLVVVIVSFILISLRASLITALAMVITIITTVGVLQLIGYSLNTITLFSLILSLALIVDDTTIMVESIDAGLKSGKRKLDEVVLDALKKVARASSTGTFVTIVAFSPMLFISGTLGKFIVAIPVTIIISLTVSLIVSVIFIPFLIKMSFVVSKKHKTNSKITIIPGKIENAISNSLSKVIIWSDKGGKKRTILSRLGAVIIGIIFLMIGVLLFGKVGFNIFPSPKDGNELSLTAKLVDQENLSIESTETKTDKILETVKSVVGDNLESLTLNSQSGPPTVRDFTASIVLVDFKDRDVTSVEIAEKINTNLGKVNNGMRVEATASGVGPPASTFAVQLKGEDPNAIALLASDMETYLAKVELTRKDGTITGFEDVSVQPSTITKRNESGKYVEVTAAFTDDDTSTLVTLAQDSIKKEFNEARLKEYGLSKDAVYFDLGQEQENQKSFESMGKAVLPLLLVMFIVMALLFRSFLQPLLIFTALPFAITGVAAGLYLSDNVISFFSMLGVFALIGISLNNTILLTDFANVARNEGASPAQAIAAALKERLRPLMTTSITSFFALLPLALSDPFWEGLAYTIIFGLLSSTILVILIFPYYYLIAESMRSFPRKFRHKYLKKSR